jgi:prevent-host-death family protein
MSNARTIPASEFKARCLALLDEVARTGETLIVTKRGRPVARLGPLEAPPGLLGSVSYETEEDLLAPEGDLWEADRQ